MPTATNASNGPAFSSSLYFLQPNQLYLTEKPYAFKFPLKDGKIPQHNLEHSAVHGINIADIRDRKQPFTLKQNGFTIFEGVECDLTYEDYHDDLKVKDYFTILEQRLKVYLGASRVKVFRHGLRKRHPKWPIATGRPYEFDQPTTTVHIDTTNEEVLEEVRRNYGPEAEELSKRRVQWVNFWKPLRGPLNDWPLILCDASTVDKNQDLEPADLLYPKLATENTMVYFSPRYEWHYLSSQTTSEVLVFVQGDTLSDALPGVPHCSVENPLVTADEPPRESIEARALVFYD